MFGKWSLSSEKKWSEKNSVSMYIIYCSIPSWKNPAERHPKTPCISFPLLFFVLTTSRMFLHTENRKHTACCHDIVTVTMTTLLLPWQHKMYVLNYCSRFIGYIYLETIFFANSRLKLAGHSIRHPELIASDLVLWELATFICCWDRKQRGTASPDPGQVNMEEDIRFGSDFSFLAPT